MASPKLLDVLIPTYKRPETVATAIESVLDQILANNLQEYVNIIVCDDCSPGFAFQSVTHIFHQYPSFFFCSKNEVNLGMSRNIHKMVSESSSTACMILTDDDSLTSGSLLEIISSIRQYLNPDIPLENPIGAIFTPRFSYYTWGELKCVVCKPFASDKLIHSSPINLIKYSGNAFILTGLIFRPSLVDFDIWNSHIDNAFFPILYFASIINKTSVAFLCRNWFHHTCCNETFWDAWGTTPQEQALRLHHDRIKALIVIREKYCLQIFTTPSYFQFVTSYVKELSTQLLPYRGKLVPHLRVLYPLLKRSPAFTLAYLITTPQRCLTRLSPIVSNLISKLKRR